MGYWNSPWWFNKKADGYRQIQYNGLLTAVNSLNVDDKLVTEPNTVKSVTRDYWSNLYKQQDMLDLPKL